MNIVVTRKRFEVNTEEENIFYILHFLLIPRPSDLSEDCSKLLNTVNINIKKQAV